MFFFHYAIYICSCSPVFMKNSVEQGRDRKILLTCVLILKKLEILGILYLMSPLPSFISKSLEILFVSLFFLV